MTTDGSNANEKTETQAIVEHLMSADAKNARLSLDKRAYAVLQRTIRDALPVFTVKYGITRLNEKYRGIRLLKKNNMVLWLRNDGVLIELIGVGPWSDGDIEQSADQEEIFFQYKPLKIRDKINEVLGNLANDYREHNEQYITIIRDDERKRQSQSAEH